MVPEAAPVPPPRKKRKRNQPLARAAYSMDELNRPEMLNQSVVSLADKCSSESNLHHYRSSPTTILVTPVLETSEENLTREEEEKENPRVQIKIEEENEDEFPDEVPEEIIPIEKETLFSSRTVLHSNLGFIDKLSAISEVSTVSTESGFEDRADVCKSSELSGSVTSSESISTESGLTILAHIQDINNVSQLNEANIREKTAISKTEWLQSILKEEPGPFLISGDSERHQVAGEKSADSSVQLSSSLGEHLHREVDASVTDNGGNKTPPPTPERHPSTLETAGANHSVLLELLQKNKAGEQPVTSNPFLYKEESIFLTDTKTNIIYKSLSSDNLTEVYDDQYTEDDMKLNSFILLSDTKDDRSKISLKPIMIDVAFQAPTLIQSDDGLNSVFTTKQSNIVSSQDSKDISVSPKGETTVDLHLTETKHLVNGNLSSSTSTSSHDKLENAGGTSESSNQLSVKEKLTQKESLSSSRRSSLTDSLHEFEMSIYDMLHESKKNRDSSDEEESLKTVTKAGTSKT